MAKPDPSFKSKRYRDKLRQEVRDLEHMLPVERSALHRRLDSQTIFRLAIAYFRTKLFLSDIMKDTEKNDYKMATEGPKPDPDSPETGNSQMEISDVIQTDLLLQAMDGFVVALTSDGTMMYVSSNILHHLGFNQVDVMMRCIYGIVHPDDHQELKSILEGHLTPDFFHHGNQEARDAEGYSKQGARMSFLCRMKCFSGSTTGYVKMHCVGHLRSFPSIATSQRTTNDILFAFCRPFVSMANESSESRKSGFWTKHDLDLKFKQMDKNIEEMLGYSEKTLEQMTLYQLLHPEDLHTLSSCHKTLMSREEIQTLYVRVQHADGTWQWLHTRGKLVFKNAKKYSIVFTHCPVREEDSTYIQQEVILRQKYALHNLMHGTPQPPTPAYVPSRPDPIYTQPHDYHDSLPACPSSWHTSPDRHSPVFPHNHVTHTVSKKQKLASAFKMPDGARFEQWRNTDSWQNVGLESSRPAQIYRPVPQKLRRYHLRFDGIGIPSPIIAPQSCVNQFSQSEYSTMFIQGHVTAVEAGFGTGHTMHPHNCTPTMYDQHYPPNYSSHHPWYPPSQNTYAKYPYCDRYTNSTVNNTEHGDVPSKERNEKSICTNQSSHLSDLVNDYSDVPGFVKIEQTENPYVGCGVPYATRDAPYETHDAPYGTRDAQSSFLSCRFAASETSGVLPQQPCHQKEDCNDNMYTENGNY